MFPGKIIDVSAFFTFYFSHAYPLSLFEVCEMCYICFSSAQICSSFTGETSAAKEVYLEKQTEKSEKSKQRIQLI